MVKYRVYLYKLDIDEVGTIITIDDRPIEKYLLSYAMLFDRVILQSSAFFKRTDLYNLLYYHPSIFHESHEGLPIISPYRGVNEESSIQYIESRYRALENGPKHNPERDAYNENNARRIARKLDRELPSRYMPRAFRSTDSIFRKLVDSEAKMLNNALQNLPYSTRIRYLMHKFARDEETFQTFLLLDSIQDKTNITSSGIVIVGNILRHNYYEANAIANKCFQINDCHVQYNNVKRFLKISSLDIIVDCLCNPNDSDDCKHISQIKGNSCYGLLQDLYFSLSSSSINALYNIYLRTDSRRGFYKKDEFKKFCHMQGLDYPNYKKAFEQLHDLCESFRKSRIIR